jgi:hypothetical protein
VRPEEREWISMRAAYKCFKVRHAMRTINHKLYLT